MAKKDLYCPKCKKFPDEIDEVYHDLRERRVWNVDTYELVSSDLENPDETVCADCETELIVK